MPAAYLGLPVNDADVMLHTIGRYSFLCKFGMEFSGFHEYGDNTGLFEFVGDKDVILAFSAILNRIGLWNEVVLVQGQGEA